MLEDDYSNLTVEQITSLWSVDALPANKKLRELNRRMTAAGEAARTGALAVGGFSVAEIEEQVGVARMPFQVQIDEIEAADDDHPVTLDDLV